METRTFDAGTGALRTLRGPNLLTTTKTNDGFGRVTSEELPNGNKTTLSLRSCNGMCPLSATVAAISEQFNNGSRIAVPFINYLDSAGQVVRMLTWGFTGRPIVVDTRYDSIKRTTASDQPRYEASGADAAEAAVLARSERRDELNRVFDEYGHST